jgi:hypothetical protein
MSQQISRKERYDVQDFRCGMTLAQKPGFLSQNAGLRIAPRPYPSHVTRHESPTLPESSMSRRQISLVVIAIASLVVSACGTSPTAPRNDAPLVVSGSGG